MNSALYDQFGPPHQVLRVSQIEQPQPGPGEVRVRVRVAGVNPTDCRQRSGGFGPEMPFPYLVPGQDAAGEIDAVGEGVSDDRIGERVWLYFAGDRRQHGSAAEWICLPAEQAVGLPEEASFELGASLGIPALTAQHCLFADGTLAQRTVLVAGGAGAVGHYAIELARHGGARVIATVSSEEKATLARDAGADEVVDYRDEGAAEAIRAAAPEGVDRIVEVAPVANAQLDRAVLAPRGTIAIYATDGELTVPVQELMHRNATLEFVRIYGAGAAAIRLAVEGVSQALAAGALSRLPEHSYPLEQIADAHEAVEKHAVGKVLIEL